MSLSRIFRRLQKRRRSGHKIRGWSSEVYRGVSLEVSADRRLVFIDNPLWFATYSAASLVEARALVDQIFSSGEPSMADGPRPGSGVTMH
jgi:hypothetical protein